MIEIDEYNNVNVKNKLNGNIQIRKITLNTESKILKPNETFKLEAIIEPDNATNKNVIWTSDNEDVATVTQDGIVTAKVDGTANIKVQAQDERGVSATCKIKVKANLSDFAVLNYPIDVDGDGDYTDDWNILYDGEEGLFLIASKCIDYSMYDTDKFTSHGYNAYGLSETYPKYVSPWDACIPGVASDYIPSLERLSEFPGNEIFLEAWSKLSDEQKKNWNLSGVLWAYNGCGPGMLDYNMWTDFVAPGIGDLCIGSPTYELLQLSCEWCGKGIPSIQNWNGIWGSNGAWEDSVYGSNQGMPIEPSSEPFILPYGFNAGNSGVVFSGINNSVFYTATWLRRWFPMGGLRPCVKINSAINFNSNTLMLE